MKKQVINWHGEKYYLLGQDRFGIKYYLQEHSFDCNWYYGFGYIETFTNNLNPEKSKDIESHQHFDSLFLSGDWDAYKTLLKDRTIEDEEIWKLLDYMKTFYTCRHYMDLVYTGNSNISSTNTFTMKNEEHYNYLKTKLPELFDEIYKLLREK